MLEASNNCPAQPSKQYGTDMLQEPRKTKAEVNLSGFSAPCSQCSAINPGLPVSSFSKQ